MTIPLFHEHCTLLRCFVWIAVGALQAASQAPPALGLYDAVLKQHVTTQGAVDYSALKNDARLKQFVNQLAQVSPDSHPPLFPSKNSRLAYWINAYNALVLHAFALDYPEKRLRLKGLLGKAVFFYRMKHRVGGRSRSLDDIETHSIRNLGDPRIHFAIVCASASCPWLSRDAFRAETLESQLEEQSVRYWSQSRNFSLDVAKREITLPKILEWFKDDFGGSDAKIVEFVSRYRPAERERLAAGKWRIRHFSYDWSPNDVVRARE